MIWGEATLDAPGKLTVKKSAVDAPKGALARAAYQAKHIIVATGARPRVLPGWSRTRNWSGPISRRWCRTRCRSRCWWSAPARSASNSPRSIRTMGAEVTVVEVLPQVLPVEDAEIADFARKQFEKQGIKILTNTKVTKLEKKADSVVATLDDGKGKPQDDRGRPGDFGGRRGRQYRKPRAGKARREDRPRLHRDRRLRQDQRARHLRHRRRRRPADAGAQGRA